MIRSPSLALLLALVVAASAGPSDPEPRTDGDWPQRHSSFVAHTAANPGIPILFFGDSITDWFYNDPYWAGFPAPDWTGRPIWDRLYAPLGAVNYGIGGDQVQHVLWRVLNGEVQGLRPKLVVLKIGTNNGDSPGDIAGGIETLVRTLRSLLPTAKILLLGILPRDGEAQFDKIAAINNIIKDLQDGRDIFYLDMFWEFVAWWGQTRAELYIDGLHLRPAGYQKWADVMGPLFNQLIT